MAILDQQVPGRPAAIQPDSSVDTRRVGLCRQCMRVVRPLIGATLLTHVGAISLMLSGCVQINIPVLPDNDSVISL